MAGGGRFAIPNPSPEELERPIGTDGGIRPAMTAFGPVISIRCLSAMSEVVFSAFRLSGKLPFGFFGIYTATGYNTQMFKTLVVWFALASAVGQPSIELISVYAEGAAPLNEKDYIISRDAATKDALGNALWSVATILLTQEEIEFNLGTINEFLISRGMDYVQSYKFIEEQMDEESRTYTTGMQFTFFLDHIKLVLAERGVTFDQRDKPKVALLIDERSVGVMDDASFILLPSSAEKRLEESLVKMGFNVISRGEIRKLGDNEQVLSAVKGDVDAVSWLARQYDAEFIVLGRARPISQTEDDGSKWVEGEIDAKVYDGFTLEVLWERQVVERIEDKGGGSGFRAVRMAAETFDDELQEFLYESINTR